jgi:hypothetical protein
MIAKKKEAAAKKKKWWYPDIQSNTALEPIVESSFTLQT